MTLDDLPDWTTQSVFTAYELDRLRECFCFHLDLVFEEEHPDRQAELAELWFRRAICELELKLGAHLNLATGERRPIPESEFAEPPEWRAVWNILRKLDPEDRAELARVLGDDCPGVQGLILQVIQKTCAEKIPRGRCDYWQRGFMFDLAQTYARWHAGVSEDDARDLATLSADEPNEEEWTQLYDSGLPENTDSLNNEFNTFINIIAEFQARISGCEPKNLREARRQLLEGLSESDIAEMLLPQFQKFRADRTGNVIDIHSGDRLALRDYQPWDEPYYHEPEKIQNFWTCVSKLDDRDFLIFTWQLSKRHPGIQLRIAKAIGARLAERGLGKDIPPAEKS